MFPLTLVRSSRFCFYSHDQHNNFPQAHNYARSIIIPVYMSGKSMHRSLRLNPILKFSGQVCFTHYLQINPRGRRSRSCSVAVKLAMTVFCSASSGSAVFCGDDKKNKSRQSRVHLGRWRRSLSPSGSLAFVRCCTNSSAGLPVMGGPWTCDVCYLGAVVHNQIIPCLSVGVVGITSFHQN